MLLITDCVLQLSENISDPRQYRVDTASVASLGAAWSSLRAPGIIQVAMGYAFRASSQRQIVELASPAHFRKIAPEPKL